MFNLLISVCLIFPAFLISSGFQSQQRPQVGLECVELFPQLWLLHGVFEWPNGGDQWFDCAGSAATANQ